MLSRLFKSKANFSLSKATLIIGVFTLLSKFAGLYRERLLVTRIGVGDTLDVYFASFRIPDLVFNLLVLGTLSVAFLPVFAGYWNKDKKRANAIASTVLNFSFMGMAGIVLVLFVFARPFTHLLVPGFHDEKFEATVQVTRILLLSPLIFTISNVVGSVLHAFKRFLVVSFAPIFYNVGIIFGLLFFYPHFGLEGLAYGVLLGAILHLLVQIPVAFANGFRWQPVLELKDTAVRQIGKLFVPRIVGLDISQVSLLVGSIIGSLLATGSITIFNLANNLQSVPTSVFAFSAAVAAFPVLSETFAAKNTERFMHTLAKTLIQILYFMVPIAILVLIFRAHLVRLIYGAGKFSWTDTILTFRVLGIFAFSLVSQSLIPLLARSFYARRNTFTPVSISLVAMLINVIFSYLLALRYGLIGIVIGFVVASIFNTAVLFFAIRRELRKELSLQLSEYFDHIIMVVAVKIIFASVMMGITAYGCLYLLAAFLDTHTGLGLLLQAGISALFACLVYVFTTYAMGLKEARKITSIFWRAIPSL